MGSLTPDQLAALPGRKKSLEYLEREFDLCSRDDRLLQGRWVLGLAVANGGALAALGGKMLDMLGEPSTNESRAALALSIPPLWFFIVGLALSGAAGLTELIRNQRMLASIHRSICIRQTYPQAVTRDQVDAPPIWDWAVEIGAGAAFIGGLAYPLVVLGTRYFTTGAIDW